MIRSFAKQILSIALSFLLVVATTPFEAGAQQSASAGYSGQGVPLTPDELQALVAPIALYPDSLVAQILGAATFPDQVAAAASLLQQNSLLSGANLMEAVNAQAWDPSVKALTQFPSVLANMATNLSWTSSLGEAYHTQAADVMAAVQVLRAKALAAGNLKSGSQIVVSQQSPQVIVIQSANPQVVYVPVYNPAVVYGYPYVVPAYVAPPVAATAVLAFGVGIAVGAMMSGGCCGWGYSSWNCGWHGTTTVVYHGGAYYGNSAWHGGYYGSSASAYGPYGSAHASSGYNPSTGTYARGAHSLERLRQCKCRSSIQPKNRGLCLDCARFQCLWQLWEPRRFRKTAPLHTASIKRPLRERRVRCTPRMGARRMAHRASTATAPPLVRPQTATSTRPRTATPTRTPGADGARKLQQHPEIQRIRLGRAGKE